MHLTVRQVKSTIRVHMNLLAALLYVRRYCYSATPYHNSSHYYGSDACELEMKKDTASTFSHNTVDIPCSNEIVHFVAFYSKSTDTEWGLGVGGGVGGGVG